MKIFPIIDTDVYGYGSTCLFCIKSKMLINWFSIDNHFRVMKGWEKNKGLYVSKAVIKELRNKEKEGIVSKTGFSSTDLNILLLT